LISSLNLSFAQLWQRNSFSKDIRVITTCKITLKEKSIPHLVTPSFSFLYSIDCSSHLSIVRQVLAPPFYHLKILRSHGFKTFFKHQPHYRGLGQVMVIRKRRITLR